MVELADTLVSGTSAVKSMEVQVFFRAIKKGSIRQDGAFFLLIRTEEDLNFRGRADQREEKAPGMAPPAPGGGP